MKTFIISIITTLVLSATAFAFNAPAMDKRITETNFLITMSEPPPVAGSYDIQKPTRALCSATLINLKERLLLTAAHCFEDSKQSILMAAQPGYNSTNNAHSFKVIAIDHNVDLAVIQITDALPNLEDSQLSATMPVIRGTPVYAVGNPLGIYGVLSEGIIEKANVTVDSSGNPMTLISAALSPGNSGGAVYDEEGHIIGVSDSILENRSNLNFMIPLTTIKKFLTTNHIDYSVAQ